MDKSKQDQADPYRGQILHGNQYGSLLLIIKGGFKAWVLSELRAECWEIHNNMYHIAIRETPGVSCLAFLFLSPVLLTVRPPCALMGCDGQRFFYQTVTWLHSPCSSWYQAPVYGLHWAQTLKANIETYIKTRSSFTYKSSIFSKPLFFLLC